MSRTLELPLASPPSAPREPARFHMSLNVRDLKKTTDFFQVFLGLEPAKCRPDYAKFEMLNPPLVLSLEPHAALPGGNLNHLGFRVANSEALVEVQRRLELAGISTVREEGVECCYARQTKFWVHDPDGNMWEIYTLDEDIEHRGDGRVPVSLPASETSGTEPAASAAIWSHQLGTPFPVKLPILDQTVDVVALQGTHNEKQPTSIHVARLQEAFRVLKPGGVVQLHLLTSDRPVLTESLVLPGPAAAVQQVPVDADVTSWLSEAGFVDIQFTFHATSPCFRVGDAELRETRLEGKRQNP
ncbi:MAG: ArsI/CadI family heavy metal resistance metalloenzyme [Pirellulales bacterium]